MHSSYILESQIIKYDSFQIPNYPALACRGTFTEMNLWSGSSGEKLTPLLIAESPFLRVHKMIIS